MSDKIFISADELQVESYKLARKILDSGFRPDFVVALWRGGTPVGIYVQEFLRYHGVKADHIAIRTKRYQEGEIDSPNAQVVVDGLEYLIDHANAEHSLLLIDDVYDTGLSIQETIYCIRERMRKNTPHDIRVATAYFKPGRNQTERTPEFYVHETDAWLIFPHELENLSEKEIREHKGDAIADLLTKPL